MGPVVVLVFVLCCNLTASGNGFLPEIESTNVKPANQLKDDESKLDASPDKFTQQLEEDYENEMDASANNFRKELEDDDENEMDASADNFRKHLEDDDENEIYPTANDFNKQLEEDYENEMDSIADKSTSKLEDDYVREMTNYGVLAGESKNLLSAETIVDESSGASGGRVLQLYI